MPMRHLSGMATKTWISAVVGVLMCCSRGPEPLKDPHASPRASGAAGQLLQATTGAGRVLASWPLPSAGDGTPEFVTAIARCGDTFFLVDRRLALVYQTTLDGRGRRIGQQGSGDGQFKGPTGVAADCAGALLYVVDVTGISVFSTDTGRFVRRFPLPAGFTNRSGSVLFDGAASSLYVSGVWPRVLQHEIVVRHGDGLAMEDRQRQHLDCPEDDLPHSNGRHVVLTPVLVHSNPGLLRDADELLLLRWTTTQVDLPVQQ